MGIICDEKGDLKEQFIEWFRKLTVLAEIEIPRYIQNMPNNLKNCAFQTFCYASNHAHSAIVFLRIEIADQVKLFLLLAKSQMNFFKMHNYTLNGTFSSLDWL